MAYDVYSKEDVDPSAGLTSAWLDTYGRNLEELEDYYVGNHPTTMLTKKQHDNHGRFWVPHNIVSIVVDEPIGYLARGRIRIEATIEGEPSEELTQWARDYYARRIRGRLDDLIRWQGLYGHAYLYLWTDLEGVSRGLKTRVLAPIEGGKWRVMGDFGGEDDEELTAAVIYYTQPLPGSRMTIDYRITVNMERILVEKREGDQEWVELRDDPNTYGVLPLIVCWNPVPSDILHLIPLQDDLNKLYFDRRVSREYHGFPMLAVEPIAAAGAPNMISAEIEVGPGKVIRNARAYRIEPGDLSDLREERSTLLEDAAMATASLTLLDRSGGNPSGVALRYLQQSLESKLNGKANRLEACLQDTLRTAARMIGKSEQLFELEGDTLDGPDGLLDVEFQVSVTPRIPADEKAVAETAAIMHEKLGASEETALAVAGIEDPGAEREKAAEEANPTTEDPREEAPTRPRPNEPDEVTDDSA